LRPLQNFPLSLFHFIMDHKDIRTLKLLEEIEEDHVQSQRELAKKLNISLGLVNSFINRLAQKGFFKITTIPKNRVKYILTPEGAIEKTRLGYKYIQHSYKFYKNARHNSVNFFKNLRQRESVKLFFAEQVTLLKSHIYLYRRHPLKWLQL